jgi:uncharacterized protein (TIGR02246 family)
LTIDVGAVTALAEAYTAAWNSGSPEAVASFYADDGEIVINRGKPWRGQRGVAAMAAGFFADVPDLHLSCEGVHLVGSHAVYLWTFIGTYAGTGLPLHVSGWEEWDLGPDLKVATSRGWFDADDYARQTRPARERQV